MIRKPLVAAVAVAALTVSGCGFKGLYGASLPGGADLGDHPYDVTLYFDDVLDLVPQSAVKVDDIPVGRVDSISLVGWKAKVKISVNGKVHLPSNARAEVEQTSLLGEKYIALMEPFSKPAATPLKNGSVIKSTKSAPEVEEVLGALSLLLNGGGLRQIKTIAHEINSALHGNESTVRDLLGQLNTFVGTLDNQKDDITNALASIDTLAKTLNQQKQVLTDALDTFPSALEVLSKERGKLTQLLVSLSNLGTVASRVITASQHDLVESLKDLAPSVEALARAGSDFPEALKIMGTFPFPLGTTRTLVRGDYANLSAYINLNLGEVVCQIPNAPATLCNLVGGVNKTSGTNKNAKKKSGTNAASAQLLTPGLIGAGG